MTSPLSEVHLASTHELLRKALPPSLTGEVETCLSKVGESLIFEIRPKGTNQMFLADAHVTNETYKSLAGFITLDGVREQLTGLAIQVGRLAEKLTPNADK